MTHVNGNNGNGRQDVAADRLKPLPLVARTPPASEPSEEPSAPKLLSTSSLLDGVRADLAKRQRRRAEKGWNGGLRVGMSIIDRDCRGLRPGTLAIINAEPNIGKTTIVNQMAYGCAAYPGQLAASVFVSFENHPSNLVMKHLARMSGHEIGLLEDGMIDLDDQRLSGAFERLAMVPLFYVAGNAATSPDEIIRLVQEARKQSRCEDALLCLDYLQYYARFAAGRTNTDQVGATLVELGRVARETNAALIVIGSQGREANKSGGASMFGGRGSGEIEYDADYLFSLTKETKDSMAVPVSTATEFRKLSAVKTRFGGAGKSRVFNFDPSRARFWSQNDPEVTEVAG